MVDPLLNEHFGEIVVGIVLAVFGWGFTSWSTTISKSTKDIISQFGNLMKSFHEHRLETERRVTRLETQMKDLERICEDNKRRHDQIRYGRNSDGSR